MNVTDEKKKAAALAELALTGSVDRAAKIGGVDRRTIFRWRKAGDGAKTAAVIASAPAGELDAIRATLLRCVTKGAARLEKDIENGEIRSGQLPVTLGILIDKIRILAQPVEPQTNGETIVEVRWGGASPRNLGRDDTEDAEDGVAGAVAVRVQAPRA